MSSPNEIPSTRDKLSDKSFNQVLMQIVGPSLIMLMVGALVFFLIEVFYRGPHALRLGWVLGLFTAASVLVSRISIEEGLERAAFFGFALAAATMFVTISLVDFEYGALFVLEPVVVGLLILVVMWSTNRLTWDCTVIDGSRDVSSIGLAELVKRKIFSRGESNRNIQAKEEGTETAEPASGVKKFLFLFFAGAKNQNTPGLWVFYFAMAAFPIFGFGQWFAQPSSNWGYRWIFMLFAIYLGSALGLLMLTSLMGLERYLKQRGAVMPASVSRSWMAIGTAFAICVMLIMLLLPSPSLSNGFQDALAFLTTNNKETSKHAIGNDGQEEGENAKGEKQSEDGEGDKEKPGEKGNGQGDRGKGGDKKSNQKGDDSGGDKKSNQKSESSDSDQNKKGEKSQQDSESKNKSENRQSENQNDSDSKQDQKNRNDENGNKENQQKQSEQDGDQENNNDQPKDKDPKDAEQKDPDNKGNAKQDNNKNQQAKNNNRGQKQNPAQPQGSNSNSTSAIAKFVGTVMKYIIYIGGFIALLVMLWLFRDELAKLWAELFGKKKTSSKKRQLETTFAPTESKPKMSFAQFSNPFQSGFAEKWPPSATIQYTFDALEAWGRGHDVVRESDQTPHELAKQLRRIDKEVSAAARQVADLLGESLFSGCEVSRGSLKQLHVIWKLMSSRPPQTLAVGSATVVASL